MCCARVQIKMAVRGRQARRQCVFHNESPVNSRASTFSSRLAGEEGNQRRRSRCYPAEWCPWPSLRGAPVVAPAPQSLPHHAPSEKMPTESAVSAWGGCPHVPQGVRLGQGPHRPPDRPAACTAVPISTRTGARRGRAPWLPNVQGRGAYAPGVARGAGPPAEAWRSQRRGLLHAESTSRGYMSSPGRRQRDPPRAWGRGAA